MIVLELPPILSFKSQVNTESLYGTNDNFLFEPLWLAAAVELAAEK